MDINITDIVALILGVYEVVARVFPTVRDYSIISWIIKLLAWLSDTLNNRKK